MLLGEYGVYCCVTCHGGGWHAVTTFYICGWTTVVLNVLFHHGGVVWSCHEWSWLSYLVQCCCQTISWLLLVWVGMETWRCIDVCRHGGVCGGDGEWWCRGCIEDVRCRVLFPHDMGCEVDCHVIMRRHRVGGMDKWMFVPCLLPIEVVWCCCRWYCIDVPPWWWYAVATSRWLRLMFCAVLSPHGDADDADTGVDLLWLLIWKINYGRIKFCWVNERRKYHLPWLGCGLPPTSSLFVQCNALIDCVDYRFRHVRLECRP